MKAKASKMSESKLTVKSKANYPSRYSKSEDAKTVKSSKTYSGRYGK